MTDMCDGTTSDGTGCGLSAGYGTDDPDYCYHHEVQRDTFGGDPFHGAPMKFADHRIEVEDFDAGDHKVAYYQQDTANKFDTSYRPEGVDIRSEDVDSGFVIGKFLANEWLTYTVHFEPGRYTLVVNLSCTEAGRQLTFLIGRQQIATVTAPNTGGWHSFDTVRVPGVDIDEGDTRAIRLASIDGGVDVDWFRFEPDTTGRTYSTDFSEYTDADGGGK